MKTGSRNDILLRSQNRYFMSITIDKDLCIGCGTCSALCPDTFVLGDDGKAAVTSEKDKACAEKAVESCPVQAIKVS